MKTEGRQNKSRVLKAIDTALKLIGVEATLKSGVDFNKPGSLEVEWNEGKFQMKVGASGQDFGPHLDNDTIRLIAISVMTAFLNGLMKSRVGKSLVKITNEGR